MYAFGLGFPVKLGFYGVGLEFIRRNCWKRRHIDNLFCQRAWVSRIGRSHQIGGAVCRGFIRRNPWKR